MRRKGQRLKDYCPIVLFILIKSDYYEDFEIYKDKLLNRKPLDELSGGFLYLMNNLNRDIWDRRFVFRYRLIIGSYRTISAHLLQAFIYICI